jgi:hypothetical protein
MPYERLIKTKHAGKFHPNGVTLGHGLSLDDSQFISLLLKGALTFLTYHRI